MRAYLTALALGAASTLGAQSSSGFELRLSGFSMNADRSLAFASPTPTTKTAPIRGVDFLIRGRFAGIAVRSYSSADFDKGTNIQPNITSADARLLLFPQVFTVMVGAGRRALWTELNKTSPNVYDIGIAGISSTSNIGGSGVRTNIQAAVFVPAGKAKDKLKGGMEGEASVSYVFPVVPLFVQVGYRTEVFTTKGSTGETPELVRGVKVGAGLLLGGR